MREIKFKTYPGETGERDKQLAERLSRLVDVDGGGHVYEKESGYRWQLGGNNDWWMDRDSETGEIIVAYRYGEAYPGEMEALRVTIIFLLHLQDWNLESKLTEG
jgi:hypothetical protein